MNYTLRAMAASHTDESYDRRGNCYHTSEALYHILGGKAAGWKPMRVGLLHANGRKETHWYLQHSSGLILDASVLQFDAPDWWPKPDYSKGVGSGFLTAPPSARARDLMIQLTWHTLRKRQIQPPAGRPATAEAHEGGRSWTSRSSRPHSKPPTTNSARSSTARRRPAI